MHDPLLRLLIDLATDPDTLARYHDDREALLDRTELTDHDKTLLLEGTAEQLFYRLRGGPGTAIPTFPPPVYPPPVYPPPVYPPPVYPPPVYPPPVYPPPCYPPPSGYYGGQGFGPPVCPPPPCPPPCCPPPSGHYGGQGFGPPVYPPPVYPPPTHVAAFYPWNRPPPGSGDDENGK